MNSIFKVIIIIGLVAVVASLATALYFLATGKGKSVNLAKALSTRIVLSLTIFILLIVAFAMGWINPHALPQITQ